MRKIRFIFQKDCSKALDINRWQRILKEAQSLGFNCFSLKISDDVEDQKLKEFLDFLSQLDFLIELEDNGLWNKEKKEVFINSDIHLFWLNFYGLTPKTHNNFKGKNDYQTILEKFNYLGDKNLPIGLRYVLTKESFEEVFDFPGFLRNLKYNPRQILIEEISPLEGKFFKEEFLINLEQLKLYLPFLKRYILGFPHRVDPNVKIYSNYQNNEHYPFIAEEEVIVEGNGDVHSFPLFNSQKVGNVFSDSFTKISKNLIKDLNRLTLEKAEKGRFLNWFSVVPNYPELKRLNYQDIDRVVLPDTLSVLMNKKCNFRCDFCEFDCRPEDTEAIDIKDFEKLLKEGRQLGIKGLAFDGGEPLLHPDIKTAFKLAGDLGYETTVLTNGWHFKDFLADFKKNHISNFIFGLYGASAKTHDEISNKKGSFDRCVSAIKLSKKLGYFTGLHTVLHPLSFSKLDKFFNLAKQWKVDYIMVSSIIPVGRAKNNQNLSLTEEQKAEIPKIYQRHNEFLSKIRFLGYQTQFGRHLDCKYLQRSGPLSVHWDGSVALCSMTPLLKLPLLKIKEHSLIDCLIFMNKINELFQAERNQEFPHWQSEIKEVSNCLYCHEKLLKEINKYVDSKNEKFLC